MKKPVFYVLPLVVIVLLLNGCNTSLATALVQGTVTFDGKPLANALVSFQPVDGSRLSTGMTDASGKYSLRFSATQEGALPGEHKVVIQSAPGEPDQEHPVKELLPTKYNSTTELKATLKSGRQTVDFDLKP